jgi:hypothetical protein
MCTLQGCAYPLIAGVDVLGADRVGDAGHRELFLDSFVGLDDDELGTETGEALLLCLHQGLFTLEQAPIDARNFEACVGELQDDARLLASGLLAPGADLRDAEAAFGLL